MGLIETWFATAGGNNIVGPPDFPNEGWAPSNVNDCLRESMAAVRNWYNDPEWLNRNYTAAIAKVDDTHFTIAGVDATTWMTAGRRIKLVGSTTGYGFVESSSFSINTTVTCTMDIGPMPVSLTRAYVHHSASLARASFTGAQPTGSYLAWAGASGSPPVGYLVCNGAEIAKATYQPLWLAFGSAQLYGTPINSTLNFLLPDLRGRVLIGWHSGGDGDPLGSDYGTIGGTYGEKRHVLSVAELASHDHGAATNSVDLAHTHTSYAPEYSPGGGSRNIYTGDGNLVNPNYPKATASALGSHAHTIAASGSGTAHENRQPSLVSVILIKT